MSTSTSKPGRYRGVLHRKFTTSGTAFGGHYAYEIKVSGEERGGEQESRGISPFLGVFIHVYVAVRVLLC